MQWALIKDPFVGGKLHRLLTSLLCFILHLLARGHHAMLLHDALCAITESYGSQEILIYFSWVRHWLNYQVWRLEIPFAHHFTILVECLYLKLWSVLLQAFRHGWHFSQLGLMVELSKASLLIFKRVDIRRSLTRLLSGMDLCLGASHVAETLSSQVRQHLRVAFGYEWWWITATILVNECLVILAFLHDCWVSAHIHAARRSSFV